MDSANSKRLFFLIVGWSRGLRIKHSVPHGKLVADKSYIYVIKIFNSVSPLFLSQLVKGGTRVSLLNQPLHGPIIGPRGLRW